MGNFGNLRVWAALLATTIGLMVPLDAGGAPSKIGRIDRYWAAWEGFDPEAYVMMKDMGERFSNMQRAASIARESGDENALTQAAREQLTDQVVDWATELNPAVKPIKALGDMAIDGTQRWLDWSFRYEVNQMYLKYKAEFEKTGNVKQAADAVSRWLDDASEVAATAMKDKELTVLRQNRALMLATIIDHHRRYDPAKYEGKDIARELGGKSEPPQAADTAKSADQPKATDCGKPANAAKPTDCGKPANAAKPTDCGKPANTAKPTGSAKPAGTAKPIDKPPTQPTAEPQYKPVTPAIRQSVLDCMCACNSSANLSTVGVRYDPNPSNASPSCSQPANGACVNQGFGCWRHVPPAGGECVDRCHSRHGIKPGSVKP